jgi:hypothetical protein
MGVNAKAILTGETATLDLLEFIYGCKASSIGASHVSSGLVIIFTS